MKPGQDIFIRFFESRTAIHVVFIASFLGLFNLPPALSGLPAASLLRVAVNGLFLVVCIYAGRWCCRRWLLKKEYRRFILAALISVGCLFAAAVAGMMVVMTRHTLMMEATVFVAVLAFFMLGVFLSVTRWSIVHQLKEADIVQQHKESELQLLRTQLSPHFLFNIFNSLYGLSMTEPQKLPGLLLAFSDLLRYAVYETRRDFVLLDKEVAYIENYIELEKARIGNRLVLEKNIQKTGLDAHCIAPMLLIEFVENAFKHSRNTFNETIWIKIDLSVAQRTLVFTVQNSNSDRPDAGGGEGARSGVGMSNTYKRLALLYPGKYTLERTAQGTAYRVDLTIELT